MIKRLIVALAVVYVSITYAFNIFTSLVASMLLVPTSLQNLIALVLVAVTGYSVFRLLDFDEWGIEDAVALLFLGVIALYAVSGNISDVLEKLISNVVSLSVAFLIGLWAARGPRGHRRGGM